jgi:hypothetical protein
LTSIGNNNALLGVSNRNYERPQIELQNTQNSNANPEFFSTSPEDTIELSPEAIQQFERLESEQSPPGQGGGPIIDLPPYDPPP